jgi:hypothetical protein
MSSIRAHVEVEHPYAFMRRAFEVGVHFVRAFVATVPRVRVKAMFMCAAFNLMRALFLLQARQGPWRTLCTSTLPRGAGSDGDIGRHRCLPHDAYMVPIFRNSL